jgi:hypothetical protein
MLRRVTLVRTDISEELGASIIRVTSFVALMMEALSSSETLILTRATPRNIPEDGIFHSHRRENLTSYMISFMYYFRENETKVPPVLLSKEMRMIT